MAVLKYKTQSGEWKTLDMLVAKSESESEIKVVQSTGTSTEDVMSQAAVTGELETLDQVKLSEDDVVPKYATGVNLCDIGTKKIYASKGSTTSTGLVQLTNSVTSTSTTTAATPYSVKTAYDLAASKVSSVKINGTEKTPDSNGMVDLGTISSSDSGNYLPLSGGTLTGPLTMLGEQYSGNYALNMNNSDITRVNAIYMSDNAEGPSEGIQFVNGSTYDSIWASGGVMYFTPQMGTNRTVIHSGNIGSQSVNYATSAGTANSVAWGNVSGRPTALSSFTNDKGYVTTNTVVTNTADASGDRYLLGIATNNSGTVTATGSHSSVKMNGGYLYATSDETLKDFENDINVDFDQLKSLPKKYFRWKDDPTKLNIGTSAQAVQKVYPELVSKGDDGKLSVNYIHLSVVALAAIDKLHEENLELKERIERLEKLVESFNIE